MPEMNTAQKIPHSNPNKEGLFLGTIKVLTHSCMAREKGGGSGVSTEGKGGPHSSLQIWLCLQDLPLRAGEAL